MKRASSIVIRHSWQGLLLAFLVCFPVILWSQSVYNIKDFGALSDSKTMNTIAIQKAIDQCSSAGGGRVFIPNGTFLTGTIVLKNNVILYLNVGAVLKGSASLNDYQHRALIYADHQDNIAIIGPGEIYGQGEHPNFQGEDRYNGIKGRPHTIAIKNSTRVRLKSFTLRNGASWNIDLRECTNVLVNDINVNSRVVANNDGIDISDCHNVRLSDSYFNSGDDAICLKSFSKAKVKNVVITNCIVKSESNAIKFGTSSEGGFEDVTISNCTLYDTRLAGIALEVVDGGTMNRIAINNITMHKVNGGIFIKLGKRRGDQPGTLQNVTISNIIADSIGLWKPDTTNAYSKDEKDQRIGMSITGLPGYDIENISLNNIYMQFAGGGTTEDADREMKDKPDIYPEYTNYGVTPAYGFNCRHVKHIQFNHVKLDFIQNDDRPTLFFEDAQDIDINGLQAAASSKARSFIRLKDVNDVYIHNCKPEKAAIPFLLFEGMVKDIAIMDNDLHQVKKVYSITNGVNTKEIYEDYNRR